MTVTPISYAKDPATGQFLPGSGNPGRKPGSRNKASKGAVLRVQGMGDIALDALEEQVRQGNMTAIRIVLDYVLPKGGRPVELDSSDPRAIIDAAANAELSPDEAARLAQAFRSAGEAADLQEIKAQIEEFRAFMDAVKK
ncbi:hypothetical protein SAMN05518801_104242 [Novosphingobium sp. CF614]|uniref:DUF5681 domain-containing protein n=1 Tax=Novosphingobium sp. CF614 TaxID=1884364 RepID=UPI0008F43939|nr:hypothetical protein [Novosphingobium sp. CF614]SFF96977.1 hypothetical protein SAMN05518801_104242 [Novosphingobium sp. CF614]